MSIKKTLRMVRDTVDQAISRFRAKSAHKIVGRKSGDFFVKPAPPPQITQWASSNLVSDILDRKVKAANDPNWREFGFQTKKDYEFWTWRLCGLMCVKAVLNAYNLAPNVTVAELTNQGVDLDGYDAKNDIGWYSAGLLRLAKSYGPTGKLYRQISDEEIAAQILGDRFFIASVNPEVIRSDIELPNAKGKNGHLVLVWGVKIKNGKVAGFYIHNPSGRKPNTQKKAFIPLKQFHNAFSRRGFTIWQK
jgi:hypothetical protein